MKPLLIHPQFHTKTILAVFASGLLISTVLIAMALAVGEIPIRWEAVLGGDQNDPSFQIFFYWRLPEVLLAYVVGGGLAIAGLIFQALLQNPLASPYTLGVASGAGLGAVIAIALPSSLSIPFIVQRWFQVPVDATNSMDWLSWLYQILGFSQTAFFAFLGALIAVIIVYYLGKVHSHHPSMMYLILAGITLNFVFSGLTLFVQYLSDPYKTDRMIRWLMADLEISSYPQLLFLTSFVLIFYFFIFRKIQTLNLIRLGFEVGTSRGIDYPKKMRFYFIITSLLTAIIVSVTGPIAFIGLIIPHFLRLLFGSDHRILVPSAIFLGGSFLVLCDVLSRCLLFWLGIESKLPIGVVTSILGGPLFILILYQNRNRNL